MSEKKIDIKEQNNGRVGFSMVFGLNARLFFRLLKIFVVLNLLFLTVGFSAVIIYGEGVTAPIAPYAPVLKAERGDGLLSAAGLFVSEGGGPPSGIKIPGPLISLLPKEAPPGERYFCPPREQEGQSLFDRLKGASYQLYIRGDRSYVVGARLAPVVEAIELVFWCVAVGELLFLLGNLFWGAKTARKTLRPVAELAEATRSLNAARAALSPVQMEQLAGKLDKIDADKLDTRISLSATQQELKMLALAINSMLDRINSSYRAQVRFVSDASHELRTPISVIQGYANLLDRWGKHDEKVLQESIDAIKEEAAGMKSLIEQLLFLARGDNDTMLIVPERFELSSLAGEVLKETRMIDGGHTLEAQLKTAVVTADEGLIKQAVRILVDNAVKYTPTGGTITIVTESGEGWARLTICDEGIGIATGDLSKIFDRFYRAEESRARATGGAGLGLSIAKWIAERHGGHMEIVSREGIGTKISIVLPLAPVEEKVGDEGRGE